MKPTRVHAPHNVSCTFRSPTPSDVDYLVTHMREADRREVKRMSGFSVDGVVRMSMAASTVCHAAVASTGEPLCIFGGSNVNLSEGTAVLWMLSTDVVDRRPYEFAVGSLAGVDLVCSELQHVAEFSNFVDSEYEKATRWVEWFGGRFTGAVVTGRCGGTFREFVFKNPYFKEA